MLSRIRELVPARSTSPADSEGLERYLEATVMESLSLFPIGPMAGARLVMKPFLLDRFMIPVGTMLVNCPYLLHARAEVYPEPERFDPQRFMDMKPGGFTFSSFGGGERICIGRMFAMHEMKIVLQTLFSAPLDYELDEHPVAGVWQRFFLSPRDGLRIRVRQRGAS
jgi:cytochrome P450